MRIETRTVACSTQPHLILGELYFLLNELLEVSSDGSPQRACSSIQGHLVIIDHGKLTFDVHLLNVRWMSKDGLTSFLS